MTALTRTVTKLTPDLKVVAYEDGSLVLECISTRSMLALDADEVEPLTNWLKGHLATHTAHTAKYEVRKIDQRTWGVYRGDLLATWRPTKGEADLACASLNAEL